MSLTFEARLAQRQFDVELSMGPGERVAVLGPNGAGKSTLLGLLAGTLRADAGSAALDDRLLFDLGAGRRRWLAPHARGVALLAQDALLFPHLTVLDNVAFGPRVAGATKQQAAATAERWLREVGVSDLAARRPGQLSGGQAQRVAIARALATGPRLLLLDEPMAALDVSVAPLLRRVLRRLLVDQATIIVTHDLLDAVLLADRVVVLEQGRVAEAGPTDEVLRHPRTRFTARLAGLNLVRGSLADGAVHDASGLVVQGTRADPGAPSEGEPAAAVFAPSGVSIFTDPQQGSPRNNLSVTIAEIEPLGDLVRVRGDDHHGHLLAADVTPLSVAELDLYPGREVTYSIKAAGVTIYPL